MTRPSVSVVIPCFNQGLFLRDALDSVFHQTLQPTEVLVVDDGSTDATSVIAGACPGVRCVRQPNLGLARARNRGLRETSGEFLVFLDADDRLLPEALAIGVAELQARPGCAFVFGRCDRIDRSGHRLPTVPPPPIDGDAYAALLRNNPVWTPAVAMFRRSVCAPWLRFNPAVGPAADYDLYLRLARHRHIHGHGRLVAEYRLHDASMSRDGALMLRSTVKVLRSQRRHVAGAVDRMAAWEYGVRSFRHHYGDQVVEQIRTDWREPAKWARLVRNAGVLLRYHPGCVLRRTGRQLQRVVTRSAATRESPAGARGGRVQAPSLDGAPDLDGTPRES
jgi:glycosyltransferase involved in cell wall biosynthesis